MMITVKADSVGGHKCFILYREGKPIATVWEPFGPGAPSIWHGGIDAHQMQEIGQLLETMYLMHMTHGEMQQAVQAYLSDLNKET